MPTKRELERMIAEGEFDPEDDDDEYTLGFADGSYVTGRHSRVSKIAAARGVKLEPDPEPAEGDDGGKGKVVKPAHFGGSRTRRSS